MDDITHKGTCSGKYGVPPTSANVATIRYNEISKENVEGLEESLQTLATSIVHSQNATDESIGKLMDDFRAFKKHAEYDIEQNKLKLEKFLETQIDVNNKVTERIAAIRHNLNSFGDLQNYQDKFNEDQIGINRAHFTLIKESHKTLFIGFSVFVFFMLATWGYLIYTAFKH